MWKFVLNNYLPLLGDFNFLFVIVASGLSLIESNTAQDSLIISLDCSLDDDFSEIKTIN